MGAQRLNIATEDVENVLPTSGWPRKIRATTALRVSSTDGSIFSRVLAAAKNRLPEMCKTVNRSLGKVVAPGALQGSLPERGPDA